MNFLVRAVLGVLHLAALREAISGYEWHLIEKIGTAMHGSEKIGTAMQKKEKGKNWNSYAGTKHGSFTERSHLHDCAWQICSRNQQL